MVASAADHLAADLASPEVAHGAVQGFWQIEGREGNVVYVLLTAPDEQKFAMALECSGYGEEPILGKFVDSATHNSESAAWPRGDARLAQWLKWDPAHLFICWDQDRGGIEHHQDWRARKAWTKSRNQLYAYLEFIRQLLHIPERGYSRAT